MEDPTLIPTERIQVSPPTASVTDTVDNLRPSNPEEFIVNNVEDLKIRIQISNEDIKVDEINVKADFPSYTYVSKIILYLLCAYWLEEK